jgi:hypothetical protein
MSQQACTQTSLSTIATEPGIGLREELISTLALVLSRYYRCQEMGFFQDGAPPRWPTLVTRLVGTPYEIVRLTSHVANRC